MALTTLAAAEPSEPSEPSETQREVSEFCEALDVRQLLAIDGVDPPASNAPVPVQALVDLSELQLFEPTISNGIPVEAPEAVSNGETVPIPSSAARVPEVDAVSLGLALEDEVTGSISQQIDPRGRWLAPQSVVDPLTDVVAVGNRGRWACTGVALTETWVITARHCLPASQVLVGNTIDTGVSHPVVETRIHPGGADVALLRVETPLRVQHHLFRLQAQDAPPRGQGRVVGFGANDADGRLGFGVKRRGDLPLVGWACTGDRPRTVGCDPVDEMVVFGIGGVDSCVGDSGGPLLERLDVGWRLVGITSRPIASARRLCGDGGIYTRLDAIAEWLLPVLTSQENP